LYLSDTKVFVVDFKLFALVSLSLISSVGSSQLVINEVCSANGYVIADSDGDYEDWIEFYNPTSSDISLSGCYLETFDTEQRRWYFPDIVVKADSAILVFCSGKDRKVIIDHYEIPIFPGSLWRYQLGTAEPDPNWVNPGFDDSGWSTGAISIGYGDADDATNIAPVTSLYMRDTFSLAATENFLIALLAMDYDDAFVAYLNGVEVARNNIWNIGKPPYDAFATEEREAAMYSCPSPDPFDCSEFYYVDEYKIAEALVVGENVLSIQIHNYDLGLNDMTAYCLPIFGVAGSTTIFNYFPIENHLHTNFKLSSEGQRISLKAADGTVMDEYIIGDVHYNHSRGRYPDGSGNWCLTDVPTPLAPNTADCNSGYASVPVPNLESGFYAGTQQLTFTTTETAGEIRYTTNGSWPSPFSNLYSGPVSVSQSTTIRAAYFPSDFNLLPSDIVTRTYIIDEFSTLPVIFITTDSVFLFDTLYGIYVLGPNTDTTVEDFPYWGTANYYQDVAIPGHVEYLDGNLQKQMGQDCSIKIHGNFSRGWPQKSFRFLANDKYGDGTFDFAPFPEKPEVKDFKSFNVRNGGVDYNTTHCRDGIMNQGARDLNIDIMDDQPCLVYINGEYWGVYSLREREDENYIENNYDIPKENIELLRFTGDPVVGSNEGFFEMVDFITGNDMSIDSNYQKACEYLDINNFCDYMITETYYLNYDWISTGGSTNNIKFWRSTDPVSKWRYVLWDTDLGLNLVSGFGGPNGATYDYLGEILGPAYTDPHSRMLVSLLTNQTFHDYFINRFADIVNTTFSPETFGGLAERIYDEYAPEMDRHFQKWGAPPVFVFSSFWLGKASNVAEWNTQFDTLMNFINTRPYYARNNVENLFSLNEQVDVTLDVYPLGAGTIRISTVVPDSYPWTGVYYDGVPITITAYPNPGFKFTGWSADAVFTTDPNQSITLNIDTDAALTANFEIIDYNVFAYPNPFSDQITIEYHMLGEGQASLKLYDLTGRLVVEFFDYSTFQKVGVNYITLDPITYNLKAGAYILEFKTGDVVKTIQLINLNTE